MFYTIFWDNSKFSTELFPKKRRRQYLCQNLGFKDPIKITINTIRN